MGDYAIQARFEADCQPADLLKWLNSTEGIAGWWSDTVSGSASLEGDGFHVKFPTTDVVFDLFVSETTDRSIEWTVPESPPWWRGTTIRFELGETENGSGTGLLFTHRGFEPDDPIIAVVTPAWVGFLNNLAEVARTGKANPAVVN